MSVDAVAGSAAASSSRSSSSSSRRAFATINPVAKLAAALRIAVVLVLSIDPVSAGVALVLEIPLLLETGGEKRVDVTMVVSAPAEVQRQRVLARPGMSVEKLEQIRANQMPDADKRARADFIVDTGVGMAATLAQVDTIVESLRGRTGTADARAWA